jgi:predicted acetyltransferase
MKLNEVKGDHGWKVEIVKDDQSISRLWIVDRQMRIGRCPVYTGGIAGVGTNHEFRNQGLSRRVLEASVELMRRENYDASFLFGIRDFYHKFGFATCMPERLLHLDTRDAERAEKSLAMRSMRRSDFAQVARLYNRDNAERTASIVRDRNWDGFPMGSDFDVEARTQVVLDARGRVCGYVVYDEVHNRCRAAEVGGQGAAVFSTILHFLARRAVQLRREELSLSMPVDHPFARYCRQFSCRDNTRFSRNAGPMGRLIHLRPFLDKILPVLQDRWGALDRDRALALRTDIGTCVLGWQQGKLTTSDAAKGARSVRVHQDALMLLAMGYQTVDDLQIQGQLKVGKEARAIMARLFPLQTAHMSWPDRF